MKVLLVDDDVDFCEATKLILESKGYEVVLAYDGKEGLGKARAEEPDLVILDVMMPEMNGYDVCVVIKADQELKKIPVILLTGGPGEKTMQNGGQIASLLAHTHPQRDLIIFDQRGVGLSEPALECPDWVQAQYDILDEADSDTALRLPYEALMACRERLTEEGVNLSAFTTTQSAADVDAIRRALGYEELNLLGGSYGSFLAQAVARDFPETVRSMVINSVWPM